MTKRIHKTTAAVALIALVLLAGYDSAGVPDLLIGLGMGLLALICVHSTVAAAQAQADETAARR